MKNWAGNINFSTHQVHYPATLEAVQAVIKKYDKLSVLGSAHSFNTIADNENNQVCLKEMNKILSLDTTAHTVTIEGGIRYGDLAPYLHEKGYALHNLASLPHITVAGSCATATHGSGIKNGNLATAVAAIEFVNAAGEVTMLSKKEDEDFFGAVVGLGALGVVTKLTLHLQPSFDMQQYVYLDLPMAALEHNFDFIISSGYSVSLFTNWQNKNISEVWVKNKVTPNGTLPPAELFGAKAATKNMHPIKGQDPVNCTGQMGEAGPWFQRLPHFKMGFKPSTGEELQTEYFVPVENAFAAIMAIEALHEKISPLLFVSEIRAVGADDFWMSPCYKKNCVALHFTWKPDTAKVMALLPLLEESLAPFNALPHWGKVFTMQPQVLQSNIPRLNDFKALVQKHDANGKFQNEFLRRNLYEE